MGASEFGALVQRRSLNGSISPTAPAAPAVSTQGPQKAIDYLDGAEKHLNTPDDQQDREEGEVPGHNVFGAQTLSP